MSLLNVTAVSRSEPEAGRGVTPKIATAKPAVIALHVSRLRVLVVSVLKIHLPVNLLSYRIYLNLRLSRRRL
jgi:hypothetical protein